MEAAVDLASKDKPTDNTAPCGDCRKHVTEADAAVECDGSCKRWYHKDCAGVSAGDYATLNKPSSSLLWLCRDCKGDFIMLKNGKEELKAIWEEIRSLKATIKQTVADEIRKALPRPEQRPARKDTRTTVIVENADADQEKKRKKGSAPEPPSNETNIQMASEQATLSEPRSQENNSQDSENILRNAPSRINGGEDAEDENADREGTWTEVVRRGRPQRPNIRGSKQVQDTNLKAADKIAWLYVGSLHPMTEKEGLIRYLQDNGITSDISCDQLNTRGTNKAFRVGINFSHLTRVNHPEFWPEGVLPDYRQEDIIDELTTALNSVPRKAPVIHAGDLNCRIDADNHKSKAVISFLEEEGLTLINKKEGKTYISFNGCSTIDLVFSNQEISRQQVLESVVARKHLPVDTTMYVTNAPAKKQERVKIRRELDLAAIEKTDTK
ncbi:hypothetical protein ANN_15261 [Periplaneta americana]|uniref:PHD-type domain-containing protein n=1 Tax=Periplaneta americana TaxID=6978 RepID=A0ABQ8SFV7_PERAM|nr:hypothetical protein ANN_15261 [Periplaneta americana]